MFDLKEIVTDDLKKLVKSWKKGQELEAIIHFQIDQNTQNNYEKFNNSLKHMISVFGRDALTEAPEVLDININDQRYSISSASEVAKYCNNIMPESESVNVMSKRTINAVKIKALGVNVKLSNETDVQNPDIAVILSNSSPKMFRLKKRYSINNVSDGGDYRFDFTIVKSAHGVVLSDVIKQMKTEYEMEVEYIGSKPPKIEDLLDYVVEILKSTTNELFYMPFVDKTNILAKYKDLVGQSYFIGPNLVTLELVNIIPTTGADTLSNIPSVLTDYTVTEKADGERVLIFVDDAKYIYMINNRMNIMATGMKSKHHINCILDAERVVNMDGTCALLIFDAYYLDSMNIAGHKLMSNEANTQTRVKICADIVKDIVNPHSDYIQVAVKKYYLYTTQEEFIASCTLVLNPEEPYNYETDGMIFTPAFMPVGGINANSEPVFGGTWERVYKWKPPHKNTIDFQVHVCPFGNTNVRYTEDNKPYIEYDVFVGANVCTPQDFIEDTFSNAQKKNAYRAKRFEFAPKAKLFIEDANEPAYTLNKEVIENEHIVEMSWNMELETWIPDRIRYDKYEKYLETKVISANNYQTALSVWRSIQNPVLEKYLTDMSLLNKLTINDLKRDDQRYYSRIYTRDKSASLAMIQFHNFWIKKKMLLNSVRKGNNVSLLDMGCGKGGDIQKWIENQFTTVVGIDVSQDNITNPTDGIYKRLSENRYFNKDWKYIFLPLNASKSLESDENINEIKDDYTRTLAKVLLGKTDIVPNKMGRYKNLLVPAVHKFDVVSCQFALHYFFGSADIFASFIENVASRLKPNGYFIGTCFDGKLINKLFDAEGSSVVSGKKNDTEIWRIRKLYDSYDPNAYGQKVSVYLETINQDMEEYLIDFEFLIEILAHHGLRLLSPSECKNLNPLLSSSTQTFEKSYADMLTALTNDTKSKVKSDMLSMTSEEKKYSFLNRWFIFKKDERMDKQQASIKKFKTEIDTKEKPMSSKVKKSEAKVDEPIIEEKPKRKYTSSKKTKIVEKEEEKEVDVVQEVVEEKPKKKPAARKPKKSEVVVEPVVVEVEEEKEVDVDQEVEEKPKKKPAARKPKKSEVVVEPVVEKKEEKEVEVVNKAAVEEPKKKPVAKRTKKPEVVVEPVVEKKEEKEVEDVQAAVEKPKKRIGRPKKDTK